MRREANALRRRKIRMTKTNNVSRSMSRRKITAVGNLLIKVWRVNRIERKTIEKIHLLINRYKDSRKRNPEVVLVRKNFLNPKMSHKKALYLNIRLNPAGKNLSHNFKPN